MYYKLPRININIQQIVKNFFTYDNNFNFKHVTNKFDYSQNILITNIINNTIEKNNTHHEFFSIDDIKKLYNVDHIICKEEYYDTINFFEIMNHFFKKKDYTCFCEFNENSSFLQNIVDNFYETKIDVINILKEYKNENEMLNFDNFLTIINNVCYNFIYIDITNNSNEKYHYIELLCIYISILMNILNKNGDCVIKMPTIHLENIEMYYESFFLLVLIFEEVYICKPKCDNFDSNYFYLICKNKNILFNKFDLLNLTINMFQNSIEKPDCKYTKSFLNVETPLFLQNKIIESFINLYHHKLEIYHQMYNLLLNNQIKDKILNLKLKQNNKLNYWKNENLNREYFCKVCPEENTDKTF